MAVGPTEANAGIIHPSFFPFGFQQGCHVTFTDRSLMAPTAFTRSRCRRAAAPRSQPGLPLGR